MIELKQQPPIPSKTVLDDLRSLSDTLTHAAKLAADISTALANQGEAGSEAATEVARSLAHIHRAARLSRNAMAAG